MAQFTVGDRVRFHTPPENAAYSSWKAAHGMTGVVLGVDDDNNYRIKWDTQPHPDTNWDRTESHIDEMYLAPVLSTPQEIDTWLTRSE